MVKEENYETVFGVISDTHFADSNQGHREENLKKALGYYREKGAKLIIMNGDISDLGTVASYQELIRVIREVYPDEKNMPRFICTADNHEYFDAWEWRSPTASYDKVKSRFMKYLAAPLGQEDINTHLVLDGYHFIAFSADTASAGGTNHGTSGYDKEWLEMQLAVATAKDATKPIFVFIHQPPKNTVVYSINDELTEVLSGYPQIILFTSHTHSSMKLETNIHQKDYTTVNTSSMYYVSSDVQGYVNAVSNYYVPNCYEIGEGLLVTVEKQQVVIQRYDFFNNKKIKTDWIVNIPQDGGDFKDLFIYTDQRRADAPMFSEGAFAIVKQTGEDTVSIRFDSAIHEDFVYYYRITVYNAETNELLKSAKYANDFFLGIDRMSKIQEYIVDGLTVGIIYRFEITAVETFGNESIPLMVKYELHR